MCKYSQFLFRKVYRWSLVISGLVLVSIASAGFAMGADESSEKFQAQAEHSMKPAAREKKSNTSLLVVSQGNKADRKAAGHFREWSKGFAVSFSAAQIQNIAEYDVLSHDGVIVLSTSEAQGRDPDLLAFTKQYRESLPIVFVGLLPRSKGNNYTLTDASNSDLAVDVISAATRWGGKVLREMHKGWLRDALSILTR